MPLVDELLLGFETHSPDRIRGALAAGLSATDPIRGQSPVQCLLEMYERSTRFAECLRVLLEAGARIDDLLLEALLLDDAELLQAILVSAPECVSRRLELACAFTSLRGVNALHIAAEYNSVACARALLSAGVDVDVRAHIDCDGIGGQTPLFHAVNSNHNHCRGMLELLVSAGASLDVRLRGLRWGDGFEWETLVFDVTPLSYAQCGLYAQFHRREEHVYGNIEFLYRARYGTAPPVRNVPNKYLGRGWPQGPSPT